MTALSRRQALRLGCAHCALFSGWAQAQDSLQNWSAPARFAKPDVATDEGGLWALMEREETRLRRSAFRMRDDALTRYLAGIACRLGAGHCDDIRVYAVRTPLFNASMAPNGMMQVWSGLLLRVENEAQLAAVIGHEIAHYLQRHSIERLRDLKAKAAFAQFIGLFGLVGMVGQLATLASAMAFTRDQERDADRIGVELMRRAGYDPREAPKVWGHLFDELSATPGRDPGSESAMFATHPATQERRATLQTLTAGMAGETGEQALRERLAPWRAQLLEDEVKRGRPDESVALITRLLASEPDEPTLLHHRAEARRLRAGNGDLDAALADYLQAVRSGREPATTHRALGELYRSMNQPEAARIAWRTYLEKSPQAPDAPLIQQALEELKS